VILDLVHWLHSELRVLEEEEAERHRDAYWEWLGG